MAKELVSSNSSLEELFYQVEINDSCALSVVVKSSQVNTLPKSKSETRSRPVILAERVAREGCSTRSAFLEMFAFIYEEPSAGRHHCPIP